MARRRKPARPDLDKPGLPPLLQGHLRPGGVRPGDDATAASTSGSTSGSAAAQPADEDRAAPGDAAATRGKATKSSEDVATRPHLEGAEQGPS